MSIVNAAASFPQAFNFIDNPVIVSVTNNTDVEGSSMHQTVVSIYTDFQTQQQCYAFECESSPGETVSIDISSALRALIKPNEWIPSYWKDGSVISYPWMAFGIKVYDRYMLDGVIRNGVESYYPSNGQGAKAFLGGLSSLDRLVLSLHPGSFFSQLTFSRKPASGGRWGAGDLVLTSAYTSQGVQTTVREITDSEAVLSARYRHFLFVNSMGVYETVSAVMRESLSYSMEATVHSLVQRPLYKDGSFLSTYKTSPRAVMQMSSGYTTPEWADWWTSEFLAAKHYWVRMDLPGRYLQTVDGNGKVISVEWEKTTEWVPCTIVPSEEETLVYDRAEQELPHVDFEVKLSAPGSLSARPMLKV